MSEQPTDQPDPRFKSLIEALHACQADAYTIHAGRRPQPRTNPTTSQEN